MKIGFVLDDGLDSVDGVQQYVLTLGNWLIDQGHTVHYIVGQSTRTDIANMHSLANNIHVRFNKNRLAVPLPVSKTKIAALLAKEQFDILHIQMPYSPQYAGRIISMAPPQTAIVGTFHILPYGTMQSYGSRLLGKISRKTLQKFDTVVSVSPAARDFAYKVMGIKSAVVPNAVNIAQFKKGNRHAKYNDNIQTVVFLGRLVERKGCLELLKAVKDLVVAGKFNNRRLVLCGAGPLEHKVHSFISEHALEDYVECTGKISEIEKPDYLASADVAVFPSKSGESFGIVLVEAIASGALVTLGGDNPGYRYVLNDHEDVLVDPRNITEFANKLDKLLTDVKISKQRGIAQRNEIRQFDVEHVGNRILEIYKKSITTI